MSLSGIDEQESNYCPNRFKERTHRSFTRGLVDYREEVYKVVNADGKSIPSYRGDATVSGIDIETLLKVNVRPVTRRPATDVNIRDLWPLVSEKR